MRVLHIGINTSPNLAIARAFVERGHEVVTVDWRDPLATEQALAQAVTNPPDLLFMQLHTHMGVNFRHIDALKEAGTFVVDWFGDVRDPLPKCYVDRMPFVNVTACTNYPDVEAMKAMGHDARFLQVGYDELIYRPDGYAMPTPPIVFMGNNYRGRFPLSDAREAMVTRMRAEFGKDFAVYGTGWGPGVKRLNPEQEAATYRGALVAINFDHFDREGFFSDRYLRSRACGCLTLNATTHSFAQIIADATYWMRSEFRRSTAEKEAAETYANDRWHNRVEVLEQWTENHTHG